MPPLPARIGTAPTSMQSWRARQLAVASGADIDLYEDSFEDFARRTDLPPFDHIGLHGVWSWISDRNRTVIVGFIQRKLKPGGVLYVGYNALPGRAAFGCSVSGVSGFSRASRIRSASEALSFWIVSPRKCL